MSLLRNSCLTAAFVAAAFVPSAFSADAVSPAIQAAVSDAGRDPLDKLHDSDTHPAEVTAFAGVKAGDNVADFVPEHGNYTRIFSKLVGPKGMVYPIVPFYGAINAETLRRESGGKPQNVDAIYAVQNIYGYENVMAVWQDIHLDGGQFSVPKQLDVVFMTGDYNSLHTDEFGKVDVAAETKLIFAGIKPGGVYVVSGATGDKGTGFSTVTGRSDPDAVKAEIIAAGFVLDSESKLLADATDDHKKSRWFLGGEKTDRYLLRFKKPANSPADKRADGEKLVQPLIGNSYVTGYGERNGNGGRRIFFHADHTYQEFGPLDLLSPLQEGYWFADASGRACILHQYPILERDYLFCTNMQPHKVGESWDTVGRRGPSKVKIVKGLWYYGTPEPQ